MNSPAPDYSLSFSPAEGEPAYRVELTHATNRTSLASVTVPAFDFASLQKEWLTPLSCFTLQPVSDEWLRAFGRELAMRLLPPALCSALFAHARRFAPLSILRLQLSFAPALARLAAVPWEYTFLEESQAGREIEGFLGLHPRLRLARQTAPPDILPLLETEQLRILIAWADPRTAKFPALLHIPSEVQSIHAAFAGQSHRIRICDLPHATPGSLQRDLEDWKPHLLHFIGHGDTGPTGATLALEGGQKGEARVIDSGQLGGWLNQSPIRLVTLSACRTSAPGRNFAAELLQNDIPAALAMQMPWRDSTGGQFARAFYSALAVSTNVEDALWEGRQAIQGAGPDWGVPALYLNAESGFLFHWRERTAALETRPPFFVPYRSNPRLVARETTLHSLHQVLYGANPRPAALIGMGGVGKTAAAAEYAHRYHTRYPGGVFWINAETTRSLQESYAAIGSRFFRADIPDGLSVEECAARVCDIFQALPRPALLLYDNATENTDLSLLLPKVGECRLLLTTRLKWIVAEHLPDFEPFGSLDLDQTAALELLQTYRKAEHSEELAAAKEIAALLGCHTLALSNVAHYVRRGKTFLSYRKQLQDSPTTALQGVFETLDITYRDLELDVRTLLGVASCFARRSISPERLLAACDESLRDGLEDGLATLEDYSLLTRDANQRITLHDLVYVFAQGKLGAEERSITLRRVSAALTVWIAPRNSAQDWEAVRPEMAHCRAAADHCRNHSLSECLAPLLGEIGIFDFEHGEVKQAIREWEEGRQLIAVQDVAQAARFTRLIAEARQVLGEHTAALSGIRQAFSLAKQVYTAQAPDMAAYYNGLGFVLKMQGLLLNKPENYAKALVQYHRALRIVEKNAGRISHEYGMLLANRGMLLKAQGEWHSTQAEQHARQGDNEKAKSNTKQAEEKFAAALQSLLEAFEIIRQVYHDGHPMLAALHNNIGQALADQRAWQEALERHEQALRISREIYGEAHTDIAGSLYYRAEALRHLCQYPQARQSYLDALNLYQRYYGEDDRRCHTVRSRLALLPGVEEG